MNLDKLFIRSIEKKNSVKKYITISSIKYRYIMDTTFINSKNNKNF